MTPDGLIVLLKDPAVVEQAAKLINDPAVSRQLNALLHDPAVGRAVEELLRESALKQAQTLIDMALLLAGVPILLSAVTLGVAIYIAVRLRRLQSE